MGNFKDEYTKQQRRAVSDDYELLQLIVHENVGADDEKYEGITEELRQYMDGEITDMNSLSDEAKHCFKEWESEQINRYEAKMADVNPWEDL